MKNVFRLGENFKNEVLWGKKELNEDQTFASTKYKKPSPFQDLAFLYFKLRYLLYIDNDRLLSPLLINQETLSV